MLSQVSQLLGLYNRTYLGLFSKKSAAIGFFQGLRFLKESPIRPGLVAYSMLVVASAKYFAKSARYRISVSLMPHYFFGRFGSKNTSDTARNLLIYWRLSLKFLAKNAQYIVGVLVYLSELRKKSAAWKTQKSKCKIDGIWTLALKPLRNILIKNFSKELFFCKL